MAAPWFDRLPRIGTPVEFARLRALFDHAGFNEGGILRRLGAESIDGYRTPPARSLAVRPTLDALDALILLFVDGVFVEDALLARLLPAGAVETLAALGLTAGEGPRYATASILPVGAILTLSDRRQTPDLLPCEWPTDVVYPATIAHSREFQSSLPATPCEALLDIGTGTGIAALAGAAYATHAWGADIAARSVLFADFNRCLNGIENATMLAGDLYAPVCGRTFDRIVAHPPYVPARQDTMIFRDAGEDGEQILRRIVTGLPEFLRPGGRFYTLITAADCEGEALEDRLRGWLGESESEFDLVLVSYTLTTPKDLVANMLAGHNTPLDDVLYRQELWERRHVQFLFYGTVLARRHTEPREAFTARVQKGDGYRARHADWLLNWHSAAADPERVLGWHAALSPDAELAVTHRVREGGLVPAQFSLRAPGPFDAECMAPSWLARLLDECDGSHTWAEVLERAKAAGIVDPETAPAEFASVLAALGGNGLLHVAEMPLA